METRRLADLGRGLRHVFLRDMVLQASIGVYPHEHASPQRVRINVDLGVEDDGALPQSRGPASRTATSPTATSATGTSPTGTSPTGTSRPQARTGVGRDELTRVVDYEQVANTVRRIATSGHIRLVETLAERIAEACLIDPRVHLARIRVEKLDVFPDAASAGVEVERRQEN